MFPRTASAVWQAPGHTQGTAGRARACPANPLPAARPPDGRLAAQPHPNENAGAFSPGAPGSSSPIAPLWAPPPPCDPPPTSPAPLHGGRSRRQRSTGHALAGTEQAERAGGTELDTENGEASSQPDGLCLYDAQASGLP